MSVVCGQASQASGRQPLTPQQTEFWFDLQRETIERVHPSWLPASDPELVVAARGTKSGRRWLANRLSSAAALLFSLPSGVGPASARELYRVEWFRPALHDPVESALDLGSFVLAARLRTVVSRPAVARLRTMLGVQRYERALTASPPRSTVAGMPWTSLQTGEEIEVLVGQVLHHGAHELAAYAGCLHPVLAESVRLSFEWGWWGSPYPTSLHPDTVSACLAVRGVFHDSVAAPHDEADT
jgi:hypothetical protein